MKTLYAIAVLSLLAFNSAALADWAEDFPINAANNGPEFAVAEALKVGVAPEDIVALVQQTGGVEPEGAIKALYCAGVSGATVVAAAANAGVAPAVVATGFQQSVQQCGPAAALSPDPFSRTPDIAAKGSPVGGGEFPGTPPGTGGGTPPKVTLPPVDGGGGGTRPPSVSPARP